jgi:hypothetical protein
VSHPPPFNAHAAGSTEMEVEVTAMVVQPRTLGFNQV